MKHNTLSTLLIATLVFISCGVYASSTTATATAQQQDNTTDGNTAFDIFSDGKLFVDCAGFSVTKNTIMPSLKSSDGHTTIGFISCTDNEQSNNELQIFEDYKDEKEYKYEELSINGFKAMRIAYFDDVIYKNHVTKTYIKLDGNASAKPYSGIVITVVATQADKCNSPEVMKVINSLRIK